ncbi:MAG: hypothetical protein FGF48_08805, partial [Candidatus Brockarchaeota archaeon]|nr:hypothetical protein [Candidatus Brockarchaeota archaeon]
RVDSAHGVAVLHAEDYVIEKIGGKISFEEEIPTDLLPRRVDMKVEKDGSTSIWEVKTGMEMEVNIIQVNKDVWIVKNNKGYVAYYYFDQPPVGKGAREYLSYIREKYAVDNELRGKMFIVIGNADPVGPTDSSLDAYISGG